MNGKMCRKVVPCMLLLFLILPSWLAAQDVATPVLYGQEELDQMLAPIALYPDDLLVQVLMASTYPLEVVAADRWVRTNQNLQGDALALALEQKNWDPSVKSLVNFPSVLAMLSERLEWMQRVGDAFLAQKDQVMDTVQGLRARAQAAGNLQTTAEQRVIVQDRAIIIEPVNPSVVYVPVYNPTVVYGPWWYPAYPPFWYYPPGFFLGSAVFAFGPAFYVGPAWGYAWGACQWRSRRVYVDPYRNRALNEHIRWHYWDKRFPGKNGVPQDWRHNPFHRKGVAYKDPGLRRQYGQSQQPPRGTVMGPKGKSPGPGMKPGTPAVRPSGTAVHTKPVPNQQGPSVAPVRTAVQPTHKGQQRPAQGESGPRAGMPPAVRSGADANQNAQAVGPALPAPNRPAIRSAGGGAAFGQSKVAPVAGRPAVGTPRVAPGAVSPSVRPAATGLHTTVRTPNFVGASFSGRPAGYPLPAGAGFSNRVGGGSTVFGRRPSGGPGRGGGRQS